MISKLFQFAYILCLFPVCFYLCLQIQIWSRKALKLLAKKIRSSKEKPILIPMIVLTIFQPALFMCFGRLGLYIFEVMFH